MGKKSIKSIVSIILVILLALSVVLVPLVSITADAATIKKGGSGYINDSYVNLRKGAGTNYAVVTCMNKNTKITFVDGKLYNSNWYKIKTSNSKTGYVYKTYVTATSSSSSSSASSSTTSKTGSITADYVNLRKGAGTNYAVVTCMRKNTKFTLLDTKLYSSSWYKIKTSNSKTGYVHKDYVKFDKASSSNTNTTTQPTTKPTTGSTTNSTTTSKTGCITADYVNLRKGAGTNYAVVTCMRKNTKFTLLDTKLYNKSWYKIKTSNSKTGYVHKDYIKLDKVNTSTSNNNNSSNNTSTTVTGYVNTDYVNLRKGAGTNYAVVTCMRKNTTFTYVSTKLYNSSWYNIKLSNGKTGYIHKDYATKKSTSSKPTETQPATKPTTQPTTVPPTTQPTTVAPTTKPNTEPSESTKLSLSSKEETIYTGNQFALTVTGANSVKWSSSDTSVATVNSNGVVTAKKSGTTKITATSGKNTATCTIKVKDGNSIYISHTSIDISSGESVLLKSSSGVSWKSSNEDIATVDGGIVNTKSEGYVTISAYTSGGASTCLLSVGESDAIRFVYASPNSAPLNSKVTFKAITDTKKTAVRFVVSNGSTSYTINATEKTKDGNNYVWTGSKALSKSGEWSIKAYSKTSGSNEYKTTSNNGEGEVFVTASTDLTTTVCAERRASEDLINLIADYEGFLTKVTADSITSDPTLGYGKVVHAGEQFYNSLTKTEAYAYLCQTVNSGGYTSRANKFFIDNSIKFNQQQFDAIVCFLYNVGAAAIYNDSDLQSVFLNTGDDAKLEKGANGYVNGSSVNLRSGAGTSNPVLKCMDKNTKFTFVDAKVYNTDWYKIKLTDGTTGYIYKSYASLESSTRDLNNVNKQEFLNKFLQYHHAAGSCYWGLLYRRIDEAEVFFHGEYSRNGQYNKKGFDYTCRVNSGFGIG